MHPKFKNDAMCRGFFSSPTGGEQRWNSLFQVHWFLQEGRALFFLANYVCVHHCNLGGWGSEYAPSYIQYDNVKLKRKAFNNSSPLYDPSFIDPEPGS